MRDEDAFLYAIRANPTDGTPRLVYADWLDDRDDPRGDFVRLHLAVRAAAPDHPERVAGEHELSSLRISCAPAWLAVIEPERVPRTNDRTEGRRCPCFYMGYEEGRKRKRTAPSFHVEAQDTECDPWKRLLDMVEEAAADGREEFGPFRGMGPAERAQILTLPASIAKLTAVKTLHLYGSYLVRLPPEVGEMTRLEKFVPFTSYKLHWFPYELTRCAGLWDSEVSPRAIYGNNYCPAFPRMEPVAGPTRLPLKRSPGGLVRPCSVCGHAFEDQGRHRVWVSLRVAKDLLPLLVNACSDECVRRLPTTPDWVVSTPHRGGRQAQ